MTECKERKRWNQERRKIMEGSEKRLKGDNEGREG